MKVEGSCIKVWDSHRNVYRFVKPVVVVAYADTPARRGWALTCGHTSRSGCDKCGLRSTRTMFDGTETPTNVFTGYIANAKALVFDVQQGVRLAVTAVSVCMLHAMCHFLCHVPHCMPGVRDLISCACTGVVDVHLHSINCELCRCGSSSMSGLGLMVCTIHKL